MPTQSSLHSFFGPPKGGKRTARQTTLSFTEKQKQSNKKQKVDETDLMDTDDEGEEGEENKKGSNTADTSKNTKPADATQVTPPQADPKPKATKHTKSKRLIIEDDDESDNDVPQSSAAEKKPNTATEPPEVSGEKNGEVGEKLSKITAKKAGKAAPSVANNGQRKNNNNNNNKAEKKSSATTSKASASKSDATKAKASSKECAKSKSTTSSNKEPAPQSAQKSTLPYVQLCEAFEKIEAITGRLEIQSILTKLFKTILSSEFATDMYQVIYLASNSVAPSYECIELGIGDAILVKAIGEAYGTNPSIVKQKYETEGDLGTVAKLSKGKQRTLNFGAKPRPLLAKEVLDIFREIANTSGAQSQKWKVDKIKKLLVRAQGPEAKYIVRGLQGKLRIGLARSTVLIGLAHALTEAPPAGVEEEGDEETTEEEEAEEEEKDMPEEAVKYKKSTGSDKLEAAVAIIKKAYSEVPSYDALLDATLAVPLHQIHRKCSLTPGIPVEPMLAKPTKSVQEVLKRLNGQRFTCEFKYDGERAQVHLLEGGTTKVFSRNLLDTSVKFPEVPQYVKAAMKDGVTSFVLDTEVVAFNRETGNLVPFQILSTRKKSEESADSAKVRVIVQAFDIMYLNGESLLSKPLAQRRDLLKEHFKEVPQKFQFAKALDHTENGDTTVLEEFLDTAVKGQCEGLMVKTLDENAAYEPSKRSLNWLKLKKDYLEGLGDSVDLVPLGAYYGRGKRTGVYGAYLLACYDLESEEFQSVCKIGTGFSDEDLKTLSESFEDHIAGEKSSQFNTSDTLDCDVWFDPVQVWEVKAADLSRSSTHKGALGRTGDGPDRGIGLRFPRFERVRPDKKPEDATTSDQILEMYYAQDSVVGGDVMEDDGI